MAKYTKLLEFSQKERLKINGLGIEQNGAVGCRYHHHMLDNGNQGVRKEMLQMFRDYLEVFYPDFPDTDRKYDKWRFLKV